LLAQVQLPRSTMDDFGAWAAERNRLEDQSIAARHVPRGVVGYSQLDPYGSWGQDPNLGDVWYPRVEGVQDWAPYRYGQWAFIQPWGWTWIDDAPWGFAPFHYGRWTMIGNRWAWAPGRLAARPVYSPALVVFVGGGGSSFTLGSGPAVGWYPLGPGEAWWPAYRTTPRYVNFANFNINLNAYPRNFSNHVWRQRPHAVTAMREEDFRRGRPVHRNWQAMQPNAINRAAIGVAPARPEGRREREANGAPRLQAAPPTSVQPSQPQRSWGGREWAGREWGGNRAPAPVVRESAPAVREQYRAEREQDRLQRDAERNARQHQRQFEERRQQDDVRTQREQLMRQQQDSARQQERAQREGWQRQREVRPAEPPPQRDHGGERGERRDGRGQQRDDDGGRRGPWGRN
jgi:hypothetical protein